MKIALKTDESVRRAIVGAGGRGKRLRRPVAPSTATEKTEAGSEGITA